MPDDRRSLLDAMLGDGRPFLTLTGIALLFSGGFAIFQSLSGHLLPHDAQALGMDASGLARAVNPRLAHFMFHDRVAFGGTLLAIGSAYWWLSEFPLRQRLPWAWWAYAVSGFFGFGSFLAYLGYGYLDSWHGVATLLLLPVFLIGLWRSWSTLGQPVGFPQIWRANPHHDPRPARIGRLLILFCAAGLILAGATIVVVGMTVVFVPQDLRFMDVRPESLRAVSPLLIPIIAHDRAGFGGGLLSTGLLIWIIAWHSRLTRSFVELIAVMGLFGFGAALGVHFAIGYTDFTHLAPAYAGFLIFLAGVLLCATGTARHASSSSSSAPAAAAGS